MQTDTNIPLSTQRKTLKDFVPLVLAFYVCLIILSTYQNLRLYFNGVLDSVFNKSFFLLLLNHTGYTALTALLLTFVFNYFEEKKVNSGFKIVRKLLLILLGIEGLLIAYYVQNFEILGVDVFTITKAENIRFFLLPIVCILFVTALIFHFSHKVIATKYSFISRMYPFTILLFGFFLATLNADKKPINENKTQHLISSVTLSLFELNTYEGKEEYPLVREYKNDNALSPYFNLKEKKPNIVLIIIEGLGADFVGERSRFKDFAPKLDALATQSLYWKNYLSNTGTSHVALPSIIGSLPFGKNGFTNLESFTNRNTLYSILKKNGFSTSFNYGGNTALNHIDKFLVEEKLDFILDKNSFGENYKLQDEDAAGITLGYPDKQLFKRWLSKNQTTNVPSFDVFLTLSTKTPFLAPNKEKLTKKVNELLVSKRLSNRAKRIIDKNKDVFASMLYTDDAVVNFIKEYQERDKNTIFIITGSHSLNNLPHTDAIGKYKVPLLIYSDLIKSPKTMHTLASHVDIAPSILSLLDTRYKLNMPDKIAWLGKGLVDKHVFNSSKEIPLFRDRNKIQDFIQGQYYISDGTHYKLDANLGTTDNEEDSSIKTIEDKFQYFKSVNSYVTSNNKIIPEATSLVTDTNNDFSKTEMIWIESVFNGRNVDNAYNKARDLAFAKDFKRALLLCNYILSKTPRHADTEILKGRIYSWQKKYIASEITLKEVIRKYPKYTEPYSALLDTYYWANTNKKAKLLSDVIKRNAINSEALQLKIDRANDALLQEQILTRKAKNPEMVQIDLLNN